MENKPTNWHLWLVNYSFLFYLYGSNWSHLQLACNCIGPNRRRIHNPFMISLDSILIWNPNCEKKRKRRWLEREDWNLKKDELFDLLIFGASGAVRSYWCFGFMDPKTKRIMIRSGTAFPYNPMNQKYMGRTISLLCRNDWFGRWKVTLCL